MNPDYLHAVWTFLVTIAYYAAAMSALVSANPEAMLPDDLDETIAIYDDMILLNEQDANAYLQRGIARIARKEPDKALGDFNTAIRLAPRSPQAYYFRASIRIEQHRLDDALADFRSAITLDPDYQLAYFHRASVRVRKQDFIQALADYDRSIEIAPDHGASYIARGRILVEQGELERALQDFNEGIRLAPEDANGYVCRSYIYGEQHESELMIRDLTDAIHLASNDPGIYLRRGMAWASRKKWDRAIDDLGQSLRLRPDDAETYRHLAQIHGEMNDINAALADLDEALRLEPANARSYALRGSLRHGRGDRALAIADYNDAIKRDPQDAGSLLRRGLARAHEQEFSAALADLLLADELDPRLVPAKVVEELAQLSKRTADAAVADRPDGYDDSRFAPACYNRAVAYRTLRHDERALDDLNEAIRLDPALSAAWSLRGQIRLHRQQWDLAIEDFDTALRLNPDDAKTWSDRGIARAAKQQWNEACDDFTEAIEHNPHHVRAFARRGAVWQALQQWDLAIDDFNEVTRRAPLYVQAFPDPEASEKPASGNSPERTPAPNEPAPELEFIHAIRKATDPGPEAGADDRPLIDIKFSGNPDDTFDPSFGVKPLASPHPGPAIDGLAGYASGGGLADYHVILDPLYVETYHRRAACREIRHEWAEAMSDYQNLLRVAPADVLAYQRLAWLKATCPADECRNGPDAVRYATQAQARHHGADVDILVTLAAAWAESGDFDRAIALQERAHDLVIQVCEKEFQARHKHLEALEFDSVPGEDDQTSPLDRTCLLEAATAACEASGWQATPPIEALADLYATTGQIEQAIATQQKVHALNLANREQPLLERLELYRSQQPFRDHRLATSQPAQ